MIASTPCSRDQRGDAAPGRRCRRRTSGTPSGIAQSEAGRQIVEHDHALAGVDQRVHHVAADIAGAAGDQDRHGKSLSPLAALNSPTR